MDRYCIYNKYSIKEEKVAAEKKVTYGTGEYVKQMGDRSGLVGTSSYKIIGNMFQLTGEEVIANKDENNFPVYRVSTDEVFDLIYGTSGKIGDTGIRLASINYWIPSKYSGVYQLIYRIYHIEINKVKGTFITQVIAKDKEFPDDGISGNYYYVKDRYINSHLLNNPIKKTNIKIGGGVFKMLLLNSNLMENCLTYKAYTGGVI